MSGVAAGGRRLRERGVATAIADARPFTVIVPTFRRPQSLRECLAGLREQLLAPRQVLVVVREGDDVTIDALKSAGPDAVEFEVVYVSRPGQTHALNRALLRAKCEFVAFIDDDAVPKRDWLLRLSEQYADPRVGAVGGKLIVPQLTAAASSERLTVGKLSRFGQPLGNHHLGDGPAREVQWLRGANMSFRRELCRFDETLRGPGAQLANDSDASLRVHAAGWRVIYAPDAAVFHNAAPRLDADKRGAPSNQAVRDGAFNELLVLLRWLPRGQRMRAAAYLAAVGVPRAPGPLGAIRSVAIGRYGARRAIALCAHSNAARFAAWRHWLSTRDAEGAAPHAPR